MKFRVNRCWVLWAFFLCLLFGGTMLHASSASATIVFRGGEDSEFTCVGVCSISSTGGPFNVGFARQALEIYSSTSYSDPPPNTWLSSTFSPQSTLWIHGVEYANARCCSGAYAGGQIIRVLDSGVARILVVSTTTNGEFQISKRSASGTITALVTMGQPACTLNKLDTIDLYIHYNTSGEVALYCNGVQYADYTGDVTTDGATTLNQFQLGSPATNSGGSGGDTYWSELIAATTNTTAMHLVTLTPAADGTNVNWDIGGVANINEVTNSDATLNASGTAAQVQEYTVNTLPTGSFSVLDVAENMRSQVGTTGPQHIDGIVRVSGTDYPTSDLSPPQSAWGVAVADWTVNPNTGVAWTTSDVDAVGLNLGFKSKP